MLVALTGALVILAAMVTVYFKTVIGRGLHWAWGFLGFGIPILLGVVTQTYLSQRARGDMFFPSGEVMSVAALAALITFFGFPLVVRGSRPVAAAPARSPVNRLTAGIMGASILFTAAFGLYAAYLGPKIYVGWSPSSLLQYQPPRAGSGVFLQCGQLKGIGAYTGGIMRPGFSRDSFGETRFDFLVTSSGGLDIVSHGGILGEISYREEGFEVSSSRLQFEGPPEYRRIPAQVRQFAISAIAAGSDIRTSQTFVVFSFQRTDFGWRVAFSRSGTRPQLPGDVESWAFAGSYLGECRD